jgi:hypothetical protein
MALFSSTVFQHHRPGSAGYLSQYRTVSKQKPGPSMDGAIDPLLTFDAPEADIQNRQSGHEPAA